MRCPIALLASILLSLATTSFAGDPQKVTSLEGITEYRLDNGLQVLLVPDESKATLTVNITYLVGSRHEGYGETGMAHLLEHLMFKGSPGHPGVWKALQDRGAQFNGTTSVDRTNYFETLTASDENLDFALGLEADRMVNSFIAAGDLESEMTVVRNEFEIGENEPVAVLSERVRSSAYLWHNYGKSTIGSREDIERVPIDRLQAFYRKYYQPDNAVLIVAGKIDEKHALDRIAQTFGKLARPSRKLDVPYTVEPTQDGEREVVLQRAGDVQALDCVYHICAGAHEDAAPLSILASTLTADQTGRLYQALIETKLATSVSANAESLFDPGVLEIRVQARTDQPMAAARNRLIETLDQLGTTPFTDEEVNRAKAQYARGFDLMANDSQRVALRLSESAAMGDWRLMFLQRDRAAKVTPADVQRVAAQYLKASNRTVGVFVPTKDADRTKIPPTPDLAQLLASYRGGDAVAKGAAFELTYANIDARTVHAKLPSGLKLALLPKETRGNGVRGTLIFRYATEQDLANRVEAASLMGPMLMRGTKRHTRRQIQDRLAELKAQLRFGSGGMMGMLGGLERTPGALQVSIETTRESLPAVLDLLNEILREPSFPADEFDRLVKELLTQTEQQISEPMMLCMTEAQRHMAPWAKTDVRYVPTAAEQVERLKAVTLDQVKEVYPWIGAGAGEVAFVGAFDPTQVTESITKLSAAWQGTKPYRRITNPYRDAEPTTVVLATPDKASAMFALGMPLQVRDDDPDYPALAIGNFILGGSLNSRLMNRLRQKEGFSYGCGSALGASQFEASGTFLAFAMCAPENTIKALTATREEIDRFLKDGVTEQELNDARRGYRDQQAVMMAQDFILAAMLCTNEQTNRTMQFAQTLMDRIAAVKPADVSRVFEKHIVPDEFITVRAGDFKEGSDQ